MHGLRVDPQKFFDRWDAKTHAKHLNHDIIYTEYNPYTITARPSNRHGGINFGALNKEDGTRAVFIPRQDHAFIQFDYDAYHIRIMAKMVDFKIPNPSGHAWLAEQYGCSYEESKLRTFQNIYGGIKDTHIPFFYEIDKFIQTFWRNTQKTGFIQTPNRRIPLEFVENPNPQKVFNYLLQSMETELNMGILGELIQAGVCPILYQYDSFLFEVTQMEKNCIPMIQEIIESKGFPVKMSMGLRYSEL